MDRPQQLRDPETLARLQHLITVSFGGRDALYAAARQLDNETLAAICERLAEEHASHAIELQQRVAIAGETPAEPDALVDRLVQYLMDQKAPEDSGALLAGVQATEERVREKYEAAMSAEEAPDTAAVLRRQHKDVKFGENVVRAIRDADDE